MNHEEGDPVTPGPSEAVAHAVSSLGPAPVLAPRARSRRLRALVLRALGPVAVIVAWEVVGLLVPANRHLIPPPTAVLGAMWDDRVLYRINVSTTAWEALQGFLIGSGAAFVAAVVIVQFSFVEHYVMRVAIVIRALPLLAVAPVLVVIFAGETSKVAMAIIVVFFPTLIAVIIGLRSAEQAALDVIRVFGGGQAMCLWKVRLSASLPWLFAGLVIAAPSAVVGAILGEFFGGNSGLGVALIQAMSVLDTDRVWGFALAATFLSGVAVVLIRVLQRVLIKWSPNIDVAARRSANAAGGGLRTAMFKLFTLVTSVVLILALWNGFIAVMHLNRFFAKTPLDVARYLFSGPLAPGQRNAIVHALLVTLGEASYGFVIGTALAIALAVVFVVFPRASDALMPVAIGFRAVPVVAIVPLLVVLFGRGIGVTLAVTTILSFFPTLVNMCQGLRSPPAQAFELLKSFDASRLKVLLKVQVPYSLPAFFASARIALLESVLGALVAEWLATGRGLGQQMLLALANSNFSQLWAAAFAVTAASLVLYGLIGAVEVPVLSRFAPAQA